MTLGDRIVVMNRGEVQQVDSPTALYQRPRNTFVASFIGTPPMNLIEGELVGGDSPRFRASGGVFELRVDPRAAATAVRAGTRQVVLGIRPEDLAVAASVPAGPENNVIPARVELVELLGGEALVHLSSGEVELTARLLAPFSPTARELGLVVEAERIHLFDGKTRERLEH
jgi:multiple sugar transport system ATP-binding protein